MDVSAILTLMATLSIGLDQINPSNDPRDLDIVIFMQYLNLAYFELLNSTLSQNPLATILNESVDCNAGVCDKTDLPFFTVKSVYDIASNIPLIGTTLEDVLSRDPGLTNTTAPARQWYYSEGVINIYPLVTTLLINNGGIGVKYIAQPTPLLPITVSADILIPTNYQQILADGASYYLFQSETGFKDQTKMLAAQSRWEDGKRKLFTYMTNISGKKYYSTYSPV